MRLRHGDRVRRLQRHCEFDEVERIGGQVVTQRDLRRELVDADAEMLGDQASHMWLMAAGADHTTPPPDYEGATAGSHRRRPALRASGEWHRASFVWPECDTTRAEAVRAASGPERRR
jgi:hypothetical protein